MNPLQMFSEDNGNISSMRVAVFIIIGTILFNWTYYNITAHQYAPLGMPEIMAMIGALGAKAIQKGKEQKIEAEVKP